MKTISLLVFVLALTFSYGYAQEKKSDTSLQNQATLEQKINPIFKRPNASGVIDSIEKAGTTYKLIYRTGVVELQINSKAKTDTLLVSHFFTLSLANGGDIFGSGTMKWIKDDIYLTVNAGQQFGGKVTGLFKWNSKTNAVTKFIFIDELSQADQKKLEQKYHLKTRQIKTLCFKDVKLLEQYKYQLSLWEDKENRRKNQFGYNSKRYKQELEEYNFFKAHLKEPYYLYEKEPKHALKSKNIFADDNRNLDIASLKDAGTYINEVLSEFQKKTKHEIEIKLLDYFITDRTGFSGIYFFYQEKGAHEVKIIRYDMSKCAWLLSKHLEI